MAENQPTINNDQAASSAADSHNESQEDEIILGTPIESAGLISTAEFEVQDDADDSAQGDKSQTLVKEGDSDDSSKSADEESDKEVKSGDKLTYDELKKLDVTFQDSPRFKQLMAEKTNLKAAQIKSDAKVDALTDQVTTLTNLVQGQRNTNTDQQNKGPAYQDITGMSDEQIIESFESDPKKFLVNYGAQLESEITNRIQQSLRAGNEANAQRTQEQQVQDLYAQYERDNPDFVLMWESNEIQDYMEKNPGLTPIAAHKIIGADKKLSGNTDEQQKAIDKAVKEAREDERKKIATKHNIKVIGAGPADSSAVRSGKTPADLANTKSHGGLTAVLARRSAARRKSA